MAASADKLNPFDPFGAAAAMDEWCCLLKAAREIRDIDREMMETMMEADVVAPAAPAPDVIAKVRGIETLMRSLNLDPDAVRRRQPEAMRELEAACLNCREHRRCARELQAGTAAARYREFCPNAAHFDRLRPA